MRLRTASVAIPATSLVTLLVTLANAASALADDSLDTAPSGAEMGVLDFVLMAAVGYVLWRIITNISKRNRGGDDKTYDVTPEDRDKGQDADQDPGDRRARNAQAAWEFLTGDKAPDAGRRPEVSPGPDAPGSDAQGPDTPGAFSEQEFLRGAKVMYGRIRQSLAMRNLADLRQFCAPDMMRELERIAEEKPDREALAVMLVDAKVLDVKKEEKQTVVEVAYEATLSDDPKTNVSRQVNEVWRFVRDETVKDSMWLLESMEKTH
jgi:predicted lipid-binding transport protein (Tim44 family)